MPPKPIAKSPSFPGQWCPNGSGYPDLGGACIGRSQVNFLRDKPSELEEKEGAAMCHRNRTFWILSWQLNPATEQPAISRTLKRTPECSGNQLVTLASLSWQHCRQSSPSPRRFHLILAPIPCPPVRRLLRVEAVVADILEFEFLLCSLLLMASHMLNSSGISSSAKGLKQETRVEGERFR